MPVKSFNTAMNVVVALPRVISITRRASQDSSFLLTKFASPSAFMGSLARLANVSPNPEVQDPIPMHDRLHHPDEGRLDLPCDSHSVDGSRLAIEIQQFNTRRRHFGRAADASARSWLFASTLSFPAYSLRISGSRRAICM
jgi:hypothetical protein